LTSVTVATGQNDNSSRQVIRTSGDRVYVVLANSSNIQVHRGNQNGEPTSFAEQDGGNAPDTSGLQMPSVVIDRDDLLHIVYYYNDPASMSAVPEIRYATFRTIDHATSQDVWVITDESVDDLDNSDGSYNVQEATGIAIDANDVPHVTWLDNTANMGIDKPTQYYSNRIGGSFSARVLVHQSADAGTIRGSDIIVTSPTDSVGAERPIVCVVDSDQILICSHGTALDATAFTQNADVTGSIQVGVIQKSSIANENGNIWISFIEGGTNDLMVVEHLATQSNWATWETPVDVDTTRNYDFNDIVIHDDDIYVFCEDASSDLRLFKDIGAGFVEETADPDLPLLSSITEPTGKFGSSINNSPREIDYVYRSGSNIVYNTFQGQLISTGFPHSFGSVMGSLFAVFISLFGGLFDVWISN